MKVAVIGSNGQLGSDISAAFKKNGDEVKDFTHADFDICDGPGMEKAMEDERPELVVNTAAFHHVDKCEVEVLKAFEGNAIAARNLASLSGRIGFSLFHISTDYVFDGKKKSPYVETDAVCPLNVYGNSKVAGEFFVKTISPKGLVIRVSGIYGKNPCRAKGGLNFVQTMLKLAAEKSEVKVVSDEFLTPTPTVDIAAQIVHISRSGLTGLCHATAEGSCSWYEFAKVIFETKQLKTPLFPAKPGEFPAKTTRPSYSVLENAVLKSNGLNMMKPWKDGLLDYLRLV